MKISSVHIVGTTFRNNDVVGIAAEAVKMADDSYQYSDNFSLAADPENEYDANAIKFEYCKEHIGFVNASAAESIKGMMARRGLSTMKVSKVHIYGGEGDKSAFGFWVDIDLT